RVSTLVATTDSGDTTAIPADGKIAATFTAHITDAAGNPVPGMEVTFTTDNGILNASTATTDDAGNASVTLTDMEAETATVGATVTTDTTGKTASVTFIALPLSSLMITTSDNNKWVEGGTVELTIKATDSTGKGVPDQAVTLTTGKPLPRQKDYAFAGETGKLLFDGAEASAKSFVTGPDGSVNVAVTDPSGLGVETPITAHSGEIDSNEQAVKFRIRTSPDESGAMMWGHMIESVTADGVTYAAPSVSGGTGGTGFLNNEYWNMHTNESASNYCASKGEQLPTSAELISLYRSGAAADAGWPLMAYQSSTVSGAKVTMVNLKNGATFLQDKTTPFGQVSCKK
ncbi:hypothetical protein JD793_005102, partial [Citrobacter braakii]|nr:hypothetical protein [Citrobacter braakii]